MDNAALLDQLHQVYYRSAVTPDEQHTSSHWRKYSRLFDVETNDAGAIVDLSGPWLGTWKWGRLGPILDRICIGSHFVHLADRREIWSLWPLAPPLCRKMGLSPTFDVFRQVCTAALLRRHALKRLNSRRFYILMIGDGLGVLSGILKSIYPSSTIVLVDLGKTLLFQSFYLQKAYPGNVHALVGMNDESDDVDFLYCPAEHLSQLGRYKFDIAVNIASMQEMDNAIISNYFDFLRSHLHTRHLFYCCNRERKVLPGGETAEFLKYPWLEADEYIVDENCPWHHYFFARSPAQRGPKVLNCRVPLVHYYDGEIRHRLAMLAIN